MSILPVRLYGDPVLRTRAAEVTEFDADLRRLIADMHETLADQQGAALAAPQIGVSLRLFVYDLEGRRGHLANPVVELPDDERQEGELEGCLSLPGGMYYATTRRQRAVARGLDMRGREIELRGEGFFARMIQHETDHLDGRLFVDRLDPAQRRRMLADLETQDWYTRSKTSVHTEQDSKGVFFKP